MSVNGTLDDRYFEWLYSKVGVVRNRNPERSHWSLCRQFYTKQFVWWVPNDGNRITDAMEIRAEFCRETGADPDVLWLDLGCSMLEMLIGLSRRLSYEAEGSAFAWFWKMVDNLGLYNYTDDIYEISIAEEVDEALDRINDRTYEWDGRGGLFPLDDAMKDQRTTELWYQKEAYLLEHDRVEQGPSAA